MSGSKSVVWERILALATLLLVSLIAAGPLWGPGLLNTRGGGDSPFLLLRTHQLAVNLRAGAFPARWMPDGAYGFGYPFFSYYAALPYYLAAGLTAVGLNILTAIKLTQTLFFAAAALAMYSWARQVLRNRAAAWLAAVAYTAVPFHLVNVYVRGDSLSEFAAFAFYPLILWGLGGLAHRPTLHRMVAPALAYAGLVLTHNVSALIFSPFILLYVVFQAGRVSLRGPEPRLGKGLSHGSILLGSLLAGLLLSAWFWLPALREMEYVQLDAQVTGYFFYGHHFRSTDLVQMGPVFDYAVGTDAGTPFAMGLAQVILALAGTVVFGVGLVAGRGGGSRERQDPAESDLIGDGRQPATWTLAFATLSLLLSTWLITPLSSPVWDHLPLLPMTQFPWRFLSVQAVFTALLSGAVIWPLSPRSRAVIAWIAAAGLGAALTVTALAGLRPEYLPITPDDVTVDRLQLYELFTGNIGSTIRHEYLPRWVEPRPYTGPELFNPGARAPVFPLHGEVSTAKRVQRDPTRRVWEIDTGDTGAQIAFPLYYWPGWRAVVGGAAVEVTPEPASGYLSLSIPPGRHTVEIWLGRTPLRLWSEIASLVAAVALLGVAILGYLRRSPRRAGREETAGGSGNDGEVWNNRSAHLLLASLPFVIGLALLLAFHPEVAAGEGQNLTMDFENKPYLHDNRDGVVLDGWRLVGYRLDDERLGPGETLHLTLDWEATDAASSEPRTNGRPELRLVSPAAIRHTDIEPVAHARLRLSQQPDGHDTTRTTTALSVPRLTPPGLYLPQIVGDSTVTLRPVWVQGGEAPAGEPVLATFDDDAISLHRVEVAQVAFDRLSIQLDWSAAVPTAANYGLSLSLTDAAGNEWLRQGDQPGYNTQPGHGFLPTSLWPVDQVMRDHHIVTLESGAPPGDGYVLTVDLYRVATWESVGNYAARVGLTEATERAEAPVVARLGEELALSDLLVPQSVWQGDRLEVTAFYWAFEKPAHDYVAEWRLEMGEHAFTSPQPLAPGSAPTDWPVHAWIAGRSHLSVAPTTPPGDYALRLTLLDPSSGVAVASYTHADPVEVRERERVSDLPPMAQRVGARFGDMIELAGYDLREAEGEVRLTLHWRALTTLDRHYMFFVHLADPDTGQPLAQVDGMPRGFTYPTGMWAPGEVISDEVSLSTKDVPAGRYDVAIGWYDPDTRLRLQAVDQQGLPLSEDRLRLDDTIDVR